LLEEIGMKFTRYVRKDGRITMPKEVMNALGLKEGDIVEFTARKIKPSIEETR